MECGFVMYVGKVQENSVKCKSVCDHLLLDGFRCKHCDGTNIFCYLGDTLDEDGDMDLAASARLINGWMKFEIFFHS